MVAWDRAGTCAALREAEGIAAGGAFVPLPLVHAVLFDDVSRAPREKRPRREVRREKPVRGPPRPRRKGRARRRWWRPPPTRFDDTAAGTTIRALLAEAAGGRQRGRKSRGARIGRRRRRRFAPFVPRRGGRCPRRAARGRGRRDAPRGGGARGGLLAVGGGGGSSRRRRNRRYGRAATKTDADADADARRGGGVSRATLAALPEVLDRLGGRRWANPRAFGPSTSGPSRLIIPCAPGRNCCGSTSTKAPTPRRGRWGRYSPSPCARRINETQKTKLPVDREDTHEDDEDDEGGKFRRRRRPRVKFGPGRDGGRGRSVRRESSSVPDVRGREGLFSLLLRGGTTRASSSVVTRYRSWKGATILRVEALRDIEAGEELTVSYVDEIEPLAARRAALASYRFECRCAKCERESREEAMDRARGVADDVD